MNKQEVDRIAANIREWLTDEGIYKDKIPDDNAMYHYVVETPRGSAQGMDVVIQKSRDDSVLIISGVQLSPEHFAGLSSMPKMKLDEFMWDLKFRMLSMKADFSLSSEPIPQIIQFQRQLYFDGLNKHLFMEAIQDVYRSKLLVIWKLTQFFGAGQPKVSGPMYG